jgi:hypothetical protein
MGKRINRTDQDNSGARVRRTLKQSVLCCIDLTDEEIMFLKECLIQSTKERYSYNTDVLFLFEKFDVRGHLSPSNCDIKLLRGLDGFDSVVILFVMTQYCLSKVQYGCISKYSNYIERNDNCNELELRHNQIVFFILI